MTKRRWLGTGRAKVSAPRKRRLKQKSRLYRVLSLLFSPTGAFWAFVLILMAMVGAYYQFKPRLSLEPEAPLKSNAIIDTPFRVTNESLLPIYNIRHEWLIERYRGTYGWAIGTFEVEPIAESTIPSLGSSQSITVYPFDNFKIDEVMGKHLKLVVTLKYETAIFRRDRDEAFFFEGDQGADGIFHWYHTTKAP